MDGDFHLASTSPRNPRGWLFVTSVVAWLLLTPVAVVSGYLTMLALGIADNAMVSLVVWISLGITASVAFLRGHTAVAFTAWLMGLIAIVGMWLWWGYVLSQFD